MKERIVDAKEVLQLIGDENALVNTIDSDINNNSSWEYNLKQFENPQKYRPIKTLNDTADRRFIYNPATQNWQWRTVKSNRGGYKNTHYLKKMSTSLLPNDGQMHLYSPFARLGLVYNIKQCYISNKYIFQNNEVTNGRWWIDGQVYYAKDKPNLPRSISLDRIRSYNRSVRRQDKVPSWNEILACLSSDAIMGIFAPINDLTTRINALLKKVEIYNRLKLNLPILIITPEKAAHEYKAEDSLKDIVTAFNQKDTIAYKLLLKFTNKTITTLLTLVKHKVNKSDLGLILFETIAAKKWHYADAILETNMEVCLKWRYTNIGYTSLHYAVIEKKEKLIAKLCKRGASIDFQAGKREKRTPLSIAIYNKDIVSINALLRHGKEIPFASQLGQCLHLAGYNQDYNLVKYILNSYSNIDLEQRDAYYGYTVLHHAVIHQEELIITMLCNQGADIFAQANKIRQYRTPFSITLFNKDTVSIGALLKNNKHDKQDQFNEELLTAIKLKNKEVALLLAKYGANGSSYSEDDNAYALWLAVNWEAKNIEFNNNELTNLLLKAKPSSNALSQALLSAINHEMNNIVLNLLNISFNLNERYFVNSGYYALHHAVSFENSEIVIRLCQQGADINLEAMKDKGITPIMLAFENEYHTILKALLKYGKSGIKSSFDLAKILMVASKANQWDLVELALKQQTNLDTIITDSKTGYNVLHYAVINNEREIAKKLCQCGLDIFAESNDINSEIHTPYSLAVKQGLKIVEILLKEQKNVQQEKLNEQLLTAIKEKNLDLVRLLVKYGALPNSYDEQDGAYALWLIINWENDFPEMKKQNIVKTLLAKPLNDDALGHALLLSASKNFSEYTLEILKQSFNVNAWYFKNSNQHTIHYAVMNNNVKIAEQLCKKGAELNLKATYNGVVETPLAFAIINTNFDMLMTLLIHGKEQLNKELLGDVLLLAAQNKCWSIVDYISSRFPNINLNKADDKKNTVIDMVIRSKKHQLLTNIILNSKESISGKQLISAVLFLTCQNELTLLNSLKYKTKSLDKHNLLNYVLSTHDSKKKTLYLMCILSKTHPLGELFWHKSTSVLSHIFYSETFKLDELKLIRNVLSKQPIAAIYAVLNSTWPLRKEQLKTIVTKTMKDSLVQYINTLGQGQREVSLLNAKNPKHNLGKIFYYQRGLLPVSDNRGSLYKLTQSLNKLDLLS